MIGQFFFIYEAGEYYMSFKTVLSYKAVNPLLFSIIAIIALMTVGWLVNNWIRAKHGYALEDEWGGKTAPRDDGSKAELQRENAALKSELKTVLDRVAVLERIVTDKGYDVASQIEALRDEPALANTDLLLRAPTIGAHGNVECYNFIFDAEKKELLEVTPKYYENVVVDKQGKCVYSKSYGSACGTSNKAKYTFTGTSIDRAESVSFSADCLNESGRITIREGTNVTGVKVLSTKAAWAIFETSLWDTSKTWETDK